MFIITHKCPVVLNTIVQLNLPQLKEKQAEETREIRNLAPDLRQAQPNFQVLKNQMT
jgi:hypothetical protein